MFVVTVHDVHIHSNEQYPEDTKSLCFILILFCLRVGVEYIARGCMDSVDWNGGVEWWNGLDWNGMEQPDKLGSCGRVRPLPLKFGDSRPLRRDYRLFSLFAKSKDLCLQTHLIMINGTDLALSSGSFS